MYQGKYVISNLSCQLEIHDKFTTFYRRLIMDGPVIFIGIGGVIGCFIMIQYLEKTYSRDEGQSTFISKLFFGTISAVLMNILSATYKVFLDHLAQVIVNKVVLWENHKYDSEFQSSYIMKLFIFEFINSYIMLIY